MNKKYEDMLDMEHHVSKRHPQMSMRDRAAQFSPFAALTGYDAAVDDTVRADIEGKVDTEYMHDEEDRLSALYSQGDL